MSPGPIEGDMEPSRSPKDWFGSNRPEAYGVSFGMVVGAVVFAITQNPIWIAIGVPLGAAAGAAFQTSRK